MKTEEVVANICQYGVKITDGIINDEFFAFGIIGYDAIHPVDGQEGPIIDFESITGFSSEILGAHDLHLKVETVDGRKIELVRSDYLPKKTFQGFRHNKEGDRVMPSSVADLYNVWSLILPDFDSKCWREDTDGHLLIDRSLVGESGIGVVNDALLTRISVKVQNKLREYGCIGSAPSSKLIGEVLTAKADMNHHNKFIEMMKSTIWDRNPRLDRVFIDVFGGRMRGLTKEESEKALVDLTRNWFLGAVRRQHVRTQLDNIPVLIGTQGIRKTSAVKWLAGDPDFYTSPLRMAESKMVEQSKGKLILEIGEMNGIKGADADYLKALISKDSDYIRLPYDKFASDNPRRYVLIGTTNNDEFLTDPTGNRRYFPFEVSGERSLVGFGEGGFKSQAAREYILQLWAEAYSRYLNNEYRDISPETLELAKKSQELAMIDAPGVEELKELVDQNFPLPGSIICRKDLIYLLNNYCGMWGDRTETAVNTWWSMPHPEWKKEDKVMRFHASDHPWVSEGSVPERGFTRIHPVGYRSPTPRPLGE